MAICQKSISNIKKGKKANKKYLVPSKHIRANGEPNLDHT